MNPSSLFANTLEVAEGRVEHLEDDLAGLGDGGEG